MSPALIDALCIPETQTYQVRQLDSQTLDLGPVIGLLLGEQRYYYHDKYMNEFTDAMHREKEVGGIVIALKPGSIDWENNIVYGLYYNQLDQKWRYSKLPIPRYIFRRAFNHRDSEIKKIKNY
ncbi:MAG: hypothetical protein LRY71_19390 [Bacillaceae bacterium]|nr:hypothetical protein [Bacillaceae bacterium]